MKLPATIALAVLVSFLVEVSFFSEIPDFDYSLQQPDKHLVSQINQVRLPFIENHGQADNSVKYYAKTFAGTIYVTDSDLTYYSIGKDSTKALAIKEKFLGNLLQPEDTDKSESVVSYFKGAEENWRTNIPTYDGITLGTVWPNIDVKLKAYGNNVEKIFSVGPGGSVSDIRVAFDGISGLSFSEDKELVVDTELGLMVLSRPVAYQYIDGVKQDVVAFYDIVDSNTYGFSVLSYDPRFELVIDPLIASTFIGGSGDDSGYDVVLDSSGNVYITGYTADHTTDFPTTGGAYDTTHNGNNDVFVSKFNSALTTLSASTFIGGSGDDYGYSIALDSSGNVYITGYTADHTTDFPTTGGAYDTTHNGNDDVFVSKFNSALTTLSASTFIGGSLNDYGNSITLDSSGNVYITGYTFDAATDFPTTGSAYDTTHNGNDDVFVSKFNSALTTLSASTFIGGGDTDYGDGVIIDSSGNVYITGKAGNTTTNFPTTSGAYDTTHNGNNDVFVSKFNSTLTTLSASTFIGGSNEDEGFSIALDSSGNVYITGYTHDHTTDFPTTSGAYDTTHNGIYDVFVSKFNSALTTLSASTFIGGSHGDYGSEITLDNSSKVYITGYTFDHTTDFPTTSGAYDTTHNGNYDVFVSKFNSALTTLSASTFIGGSDEDQGNGIALNSSGKVYITGYTKDHTTDFPTTGGAYDTTHNGNFDVFVSNFDCDLSASEVSCGTVTSGGSVSVSVASGGTAEVELPSGNELEITLPAGVSGTITFTDTNSGNSNPRIGFFGDIIDIDPTGGASCAAGCTISFTFTGADATAAGLSPSEAKIYHDSNENGSFELSEARSTSVTGSDPYTATASASFTSKFAVGGVRAHAVAAAQSLASGGFFDFLSSCDPDGFASGESLRVYEINYDKCDTNKLQILAYSTCGPIKADVTTQYGRYTLGISSSQPFLDAEPKKMVIGADISSELESFDIMIKDKRDSFTDRIILNQCNATKSYSHTTGYTSKQQGQMFYGTFDTEIQQNEVTADTQTTSMITIQESNNVMVDPEPTGVIEEPNMPVIETEPTKVDHGVIVDPEPTGVIEEPNIPVIETEPTKVDHGVIVDPEPPEIKPNNKTVKNSLLDMLFKSFSRIFQR